MLESDFVVSERFLILTQVEVALASKQVEEGQAWRLILVLVEALELLLALVPLLIQNGGAEVVQGTLVVVHHHVALAALKVGHGEF